jgi:hypothetical protein
MTIEKWQWMLPAAFERNSPSILIEFDWPSVVLSSILGEFSVFLHSDLIHVWLANLSMLCIRELYAVIISEDKY